MPTTYRLRNISGITATGRFSLWKWCAVVLSLPGLLLLPTHSPLQELLKTDVLLAAGAFGFVLIGYVLAKNADLTHPLPLPLWGVAALLPLVFLVSSLFSLTLPFSFIGFNAEGGTAIFAVVLWSLFVAASLVFLEEHRALLFRWGFVFSALLVLAFHASILLGGLFSGAQTYFIERASITLALYAGFAALTALLMRECKSSRTMGVLLDLVLLCAFTMLVAYAPAGLWAILAVFFSAIAFHRPLRRFLSLESKHSLPAGDSKISSWRALAVTGVALFFFVTNIFFAFPALRQEKVEPSSSATLTVIMSLYKAEPWRAFLGSGPNTFAYMWNEFKPASINKTEQWASTFSWGRGVFLTLAVTVGILGISTLLFIAVIFGLFSLRAVMKTPVWSTPFRHSFFISLLLLLYGVLTAVWYVPDPIVAATTVIAAGSAVGAAYGTRQSPARRISNATGISGGYRYGVALLLFFIGIGGVWLAVTLARANYSYQKGIDAWFESGSFEESQKAIAASIRLHEQGVYYRTMAEIQGEKIARIADDATLSSSEKISQVRTLGTAAIQNASRATELNSRDYLNWLVLGDIYRQLAEIGVGGAGEKGVRAYNEAIALSHNNPVPLYLQAALLSLGQGTDEAVRAFNRVYELKPDFPDPLNLSERLQEP